MSWIQGRPLRLAGLVLIGLALVAAVAGGVTALSGGNGGDTAAPTSTPPPGDSGSAQNPPPSEVPPSPPASSEVPPPSSAAPPTPPASTPPPGEPVPPPAPGGTPEDQAAAKWVTVRVYNNSTIHGLAARAGDDFRAQGWNVAETSNYSGGIIPTTTAYFRPGVADEETAARALGAAFGMRVEPRFEGIAGSSGGVIVIVTNDYRGATTKGK
ncbi:LytR C-terminal domain-containing protein [Amycolatopsis sp. 195334CR]|uniref:LytR C-terminal domain-containing protein n=1 Tax=Amycolatopsis sp. 195334CR TaxID=2814588 RepID=UPI001A8FE7DC|nr:LytR C-terminal domain-containing protein [Amycolatopsis sp. 195334CR]MBN6034942.1 LytR C-terminal domain-containing protein [Amycolatopsis sp. 195334CR]